MGYNFVQRGDVISVPASEALTSGDVVLIGEIVGIAAGGAAAGDTIDVLTSGVFDLSKVAADAFALGDAVYWNVSTGLATATETDNVKLGVAVAAAAAASATVRVRLSGF